MNPPLTASLNDSTTAPKVLVFDSGAGGLSVVRAMLPRLTGCHVIYAADRDYFPYGTKADSKLIPRIVTQVEALYQRHSPSIVVIACNTASTLALDILRSSIPCPFVGVVPAIKPAANLTQSGVIGVLATPATVNRPYTRKLIEQFAPTHHVILHGSDSLVELAERKVAGETIKSSVIQKELDTLFQQPHGQAIDTVVMACTHFPLLKEEFEQWSKQAAQQKGGITWIDSGEAIAKRVQHLLHEQGHTEIKTKKNSIEFSLLDVDTEEKYRSFIEKH